MTAKEVLAELRPLGSDGYKRVIFKHGVKEPCFGVKIEELKKIQKRVKMDYALANDLFATGVYDAQYLAGLIADDAKMTKADLQRWLDSANCDAIAGFAVAWVAAGSPHGPDAALKWIDSKDDTTSATGWATLASIVSIKEDAELDLALLKNLLQRVEKAIHSAPNRTRYQMNVFVIALGCHVASLTKAALDAGARIGKVTCDMGDTACQVPSIPDYIRKVQTRGTIGKKRKSAKC
jgi:3-methyladenine DNA glycosylase AlkD